MEEVWERGNLQDLEREVIFNGTCCFCGACGAFCPEYIFYEEEMPRTRQKCYEIFGACYDFCPRTFLPVFEIERKVFGGVREDKLLGFYRSVCMARAKDEEILAISQDGGVVSALLIFMLERGLADAAVVARKCGDWGVEPSVATKREEVLESAGSKYTQCPSLLGFGSALREGYEKIAFVGLPCHVQALRKVQLSPFFDFNKASERISIVIGLLCTETFDSTLLFKKLSNEGISPSEVKKFDIKRGKFIAVLRSGERFEIPVKEMADVERSACSFCYDFAAELADISVGGVGSPDGFSTVIVRSERGEELLSDAEEAGFIECSELSAEKIEEVRKNALRKKRRNLKKIQKKAESLKILNLLVKLEDLERLLI
ncbi:MAG: Coenzyme F420 hydrogenase/dehydrogenase, beta subunit C-terminal domain [Candidatus Methanospirare jalkutatii]|nr:Coenzyme F420 hydrogenase/dehydrogenase, beta subunit C-terminal domain [Candidatus Methanospirare jalkutatii]